jgi:hypothetical protein
MYNEIKKHFYEPYGYLRVGYRRITSFLRPLPDFVVIGAQKSGTTTLYEWICVHKNVKKGIYKEVHYFERKKKYLERGKRWYKSQFPIKIGDKKTGEATPIYMFKKEVPRRIKETIPNTRLISILRKPTERAYSHYHHTKRTKGDERSFESAIEEEIRVIERSNKKEIFNIEYNYDNYVSRGYYYQQLKRWLKFFPMEQIKILKSEELFEKPDYIMKKVFSHIGLKKVNKNYENKYNQGKYKKRMKKSTKRRLERHYKEKNKRLYKLIGKEFGW